MDDERIYYWMVAHSGMKVIEIRIWTDKSLWEQAKAAHETKK